jgi:hypothetical protein
MAGLPFAEAQRHPVETGFPRLEKIDVDERLLVRLPERRRLVLPRPSG